MLSPRCISATAVPEEMICKLGQSAGAGNIRRKELLTVAAADLHALSRVSFVLSVEIYGKMRA